MGYKGYNSLQAGDDYQAIAQFSEAALRLFGATTEGIALIRTPKLFPDADFAIDISKNRNLIGADINFNGVNNGGLTQSQLDIDTGELYIHLIKTDVHRAGLGETLLQKTISSMSTSGHKVKSIAGNLSGVNFDILTKQGLKFTPAYKLRVAAGFKKNN